MLVMQIFFQYPASRQGVVVPIVNQSSNIEDLQAQLSSYRLFLTPARDGLKDGYKDQQGRFYIHRTITNDGDLAVVLKELNYPQLLDLFRGRLQ
jgi:hypothetical protein